MTFMDQPKRTLILMVMIIISDLSLGMDFLSYLHFWSMPPTFFFYSFLKMGRSLNDSAFFLVLKTKREIWSPLLVVATMAGWAHKAKQIISHNRWKFAGVQFENRLRLCTVVLRTILLRTVWSSKTHKTSNYSKSADKVNVFLHCPSLFRILML